MGTSKHCSNAFDNQDASVGAFQVGFVEWKTGVLRRELVLVEHHWGVGHIGTYIVAIIVVLTSLLATALAFLFIRWFALLAVIMPGDFCCIALLDHDGTYMHFG